MHSVRSSRVSCTGIVIAALLSWAAAAAVGAEPATSSGPAAGVAGLNLQPTEIVLIDGRKVQGQLACELDDRLVVYSPNLGTLASFRKEFVASYTKGGQAQKVSAPRTLTPDDLKRLDWNGWPDAPPATGPKTAYTTEKWEPPSRLIVWAKPGASGTFSEAGNWLVLGAPLAPGGRYWDSTTDVLIPSSDAAYSLAGGNDKDRITLAVRHMAVENGARINTQDADFHGNQWVHVRGISNMRYGNRWVGGKHTFARTDFPAIFKVGVTWQDIPQRERLGSDLGQYLMVRKDAGSVEFLGVIGSNDKFFIEKGVAIAGPGSQCMSSNRSPDRIYPGATLHILDGAIWGKRVSFIVHESFDVKGTLTAGMPERPLKEDATIIMSFKDYTGLMGRTDQRDASGIRVAKGATMRAYSSDPAKARLVIRDSKCERGPDSIETNIAPWVMGKRMDRYRAAPRRVDMVFLGDVVLDGVVFEDLHKGGVRLANLAMKDAWKNIVFATSCQSQKPEDNYVLYQKDTPPIGWMEDPAVKNPAPEK